MTFIATQNVYSNTAFPCFPFRSAEDVPLIEWVRMQHMPEQW